MPTQGRDYGYGNARIRGMKSRLLDRTFIRALLDEPRMPAIVNMLEGTPYRLDIEAAALTGGDVASLDEALRHNLARDFRKILSFLNEEAYELALTILGRFDVANIKTVLRGKHVHTTEEEIISNLIPAGRISETEFLELARQPDIRAAVDVLATWEVRYARVLMGEMATYLDSGDLSHLELALDKHYFAESLRETYGRGSNTRLARDLLQAQVDTVNLLTVLRMLKADLEPGEAERMYIEGGAYVDHDVFMALSALSDIDEFLDKLSGTPYRRVLEGALALYLETGSLSVLERALEQMMIKRAVGGGHGDPLGLGVVTAYVWAKQNEVTNLRIIVRGKSVDMPERRIEEELVFV